LFDSFAIFRQIVTMDIAALTPDRETVILDAAFRAFAVYGYRRVSMEDIARGAGLSRTALYLHFRNKEDIFLSLSQRYFTQCLAEMQAALADDGPAASVLAAAFAAKDGKFMDVVLGTPHGRELLDAGFAISAEIARAMEQEMSAALARWIGPRAAHLGSAEAVAVTVMAALKGLKLSSRSLAEYRDGQATLARILARALAPAGGS
jgi:AcrR family transcriptional regulator